MMYVASERNVDEKRYKNLRGSVVLDMLVLVEMRLDCETGSSPKGANDLRLMSWEILGH